MGSIDDVSDNAVQTILGFRLDPSLGGVDDIEVAKHLEFKKDLKGVKVYDVSGREQDFTFDESGFQFVRHKTATKNFHDDSLVKNEYYDEVARLAKKLTGASFAHCYQHILRASKTEGNNNGPRNVYGPAKGVHVDYSYTGTPEYINSLPERPVGWEHLSQNHWAVFSVWRPRNKVTRDALCVGDKRTIPDSDLVEGSTDMSAPDRKQKLSLFWVKYNPDHQYYYKKEMDADDVLWIKLYDSKLDGRARCCPHSAFDTPDDCGEARQSIEIRCIVVWESESSTQCQVWPKASQIL